MKREQLSIKMIKMGWLLACFLIGFNYFSKGHVAREYTPDFLTMMTIVTFPSGYLAIYLIRGVVWMLSSLVNDPIAGSYNLLLSLWVLMTILGYFQWFYLIPALFKHLKQLKK